MGIIGSAGAGAAAQEILDEIDRVSLLPQYVEERKVERALDEVAKKAKEIKAAADGGWY